MLGRNPRLKALPPLAARKSRRWALTWPHLVGHGQAEGEAELGVGHAALTAKATMPTASSGTPNAGWPCLPLTQSEPSRDEERPDNTGVAGGRPVEMVAQDEHPAGDAPAHVGLSMTPSNAKRLPMVSGTLQAKSSLKTKGSRPGT